MALKDVGRMMTDHVKMKDPDDRTVKRITWPSLTGKTRTTPWSALLASLAWTCACPSEEYTECRGMRRRCSGSQMKARYPHGLKERRKMNEGGALTLPDEEISFPETHTLHTYSVHYEITPSEEIHMSKKERDVPGPVRPMA